MHSASGALSDRVYLPWSGHVELHDCVRGYLASRKCATGEQARCEALDCAPVQPGGAPCRRADMDSYERVW
jgi:hypothetical protein